MEKPINERELMNFATCGGKIIGTALNYLDNVTAKKLPVPQIPTFFMKPSTTYLQEGQDIMLPQGLGTILYEIELGVIIGKKCKNVKPKDAMNYVGGYCLALDLTAIEVVNNARIKGLPWDFGKGFDNATPVSRFIFKSEIPKPQNLPIWLKVNGEMRQKSNTSNMIFKIPELISYASQNMSLQTMDMLLTGTPAGAGPLNPGDILEGGLGNNITLDFNVQFSWNCDDAI